MLHANFVRSLELKKLGEMRALMRSSSLSPTTNYAIEYQLYVDVLDAEIAARVCINHASLTRSFRLRDVNFYNNFGELVRAGYRIEAEGDHYVVYW